jgi:hypothetical protein
VGARTRTFSLKVSSRTCHDNAYRATDLGGSLADRRIAADPLPGTRPGHAALVTAFDDLRKLGIDDHQLDPSGATFAAGSSPTTLLVPDQAWEAGTVEAPDMVAANGRYLLFYSGNEWSNASYAVGAATCAGPLGPCAAASPNPIPSTDSGVAGPCGESVFPDTSGHFWIAFDGWRPNAVGSSNSRALYIRSINLSGLPSVGGPP